MKIARFKYQNKIYFGELKNNLIYFIDGSIFGKIKITNKKAQSSKVRLLSPIAPGKIVCITGGHR